QTTLLVNSGLGLPSAPTLPHTYTHNLPSTLPPSCLSAPSSTSSELPSYVTSSSGFAAHPSSIIAQNQAVLKQLEDSAREAEEQVKAWEEAIRERELAEKRRVAPGWLDRDEKILQPARTSHAQDNAMPHAGTLVRNLIDETSTQDETMERGRGASRVVDDLGAQMDRAFGQPG
ncbi:hypothetical protein LTR28_013823, partial [Elasticomyces elasticus]